MKRWHVALIRPVDVAVALGFWTVGLVTTNAIGIAELGYAYRPRDEVFWVLLSAVTWPYVARRAQPTVVFAGSVLSVTAMWSLGYDGGALPLVLLVGGYWVAESRPGAEVLVAGAVALAGLTFLVWADGAPFAAREWVSSVVALGGVMALGRAAHQRGALVQARAAAAEEAARRQAGEERLRVSGELHDIVGHSLGIIAIQAGVGHHLMATDPTRAAAALDTIAQLSRESLAEVRAVIAGLRDGDQTHPPSTGITHLDQLADTVRLSGLDVQLTMPDDIASIPRPVAAAVYRITQEALTNTIRHAHATTAWVEVRHALGQVVITIEDDGTAGGSHTDSARNDDGQGIRGMRDRARTLGGTLTAQPAPGGGFRVRSTLPTERLP